jgi:hypothetical protein
MPTPGETNGSTWLLFSLFIASCHGSSSYPFVEVNLAVARRVGLSSSMSTLAFVGERKSHIVAISSAEIKPSPSCVLCVKGAWCEMRGGKCACECVSMCVFYHMYVL